MDTSGITVRTNNVPRDVIEGFELSAEERAEFDYIDWDAVDRGEDAPWFFRFKGELHDLGEFTVWSTAPAFHPASQWDGYRADSFFSALVVRYVDEFERVVVGTVLS